MTVADAAPAFESIEPTLEDEYFSRIAGSLIGAAAADALGWITEFVRGPEHMRKIYHSDRVTEYRSWQKATGGRFNTYIDYISAGQYSDDTQLTLALARSLKSDGSVDVHHFAKVELPLWLDYARGAGSTITGAARALQRKSADWNSNFFTYRHRGTTGDYRDAGANGAAMRVAPVALANVNDQERMVTAVWQSAVCTHGHPRAILGALLLAEAIRNCALEGLAFQSRLVTHLVDFVTSSDMPKGEGLDKWRERWIEDDRSFDHEWEQTKVEVLGGLEKLSGVRDASDALQMMESLGCFRPEAKGSGTATVLAGLAIFVSVGNSFRDAVLEAVNALGSDTDTIGGFVGALCGAAHGYDKVPVEWASTMQDYDYFMRVATELTRVTCRTGVGGQALRPSNGSKPKYPNLIEKLRAHEVIQNERVFHPLFGSGLVTSVDAQHLRRKDGATVVLAWVAFDIGQSCKFRYMTIPSSGRSVAPIAPLHHDPPRLF